jgi:hypothetical protein
MPGRHLWAGLRLLDRQLVDRRGRLAGKVDDVELERSAATGLVFVVALVSGPGGLSGRLGRTRLSRWLRRAYPCVASTDGDPTVIPLRYIADIGNHITISLDHEQVGTASTERWVRDHIIGHIPGSGHAAE